MLPYITEFIGTFIFLSIILQAVKKNSPFAAYAPFVIGLALVGTIKFGGAISGGHYNPAVSLMFYLKNELPANQLVMYVVAQLLAAVAARYFYDKVPDIKI